MTSTTSIRSVAFFVPGEPVTQGSMRAYKAPSGRPIITHNKRDELNEWRDRITLLARREWANARWDDALDEPVIVTLVAILPRPKSNKDPYPMRALDLDKLQRAVGDALAPKKQTGKLQPWKALRDDSRIIRWESEKTYAHGDMQPGAFVRVTRVHTGARDEAVTRMMSCSCGALTNLLPARVFS